MSDQHDETARDEAYETPEVEDVATPGGVAETATGNSLPVSQTPAI